MLKITVMFLGTIDKGGDPRFAGMTVHSPGETALKNNWKN